VTPHEKIRGRAWIVFAAAIAINLTLGINYSWSVIKKVLVTDWHWTNVDASLPYTMYAVVFSIAMVFAGRLQDKLGPRIVISIGSTVAGGGLIFSGLADTLPTLTATYAFISIGNALCFSSTMPVCVKWFPPEKRGLIMGTIVAASALASGYFAPLVNILISLYGVQGMFFIMGAGVFTVIFIMAQFLTNPPEYKKRDMSSINPAPSLPLIKPVRLDMDWRGMTKTSLFYKIWIMYFIIASAGLMIIGHIATIAQSQAQWEKGFYLIILFAAFNASGRLIAGFLSDRFGRLKILMAVFAFQAVNLVFFHSYTTPALLALGTGITGLSYGAAFALFPLATADYYGLKNLGGNYGLVFTGWGFAALLGPLMAGWSVDTTGSYGIAYVFSAATLLGALVLAYSMVLRVKAGKPSLPSHITS
jgi:OFA family oxalate/formate antiporter-like MFS transporter